MFNSFTRLFSASVAGALISATALAAPVALVNPSFEDPDAGKIADGFDGATDIPGWSSGAMSDSGVDTGEAHSGTYRAFIMGGDGPFGQTTGHTLQAGETVTLSYWSKWEGKTARIRAWDGSQFTTLAEQVGANVGGTWTLEELTYLVTEGDPAIGQTLAVEFENEASGWPQVDDVSLDVSNFFNIDGTSPFGWTHVDSIAAQSTTIELDNPTASAVQVSSLGVASTPAFAGDSLAISGAPATPFTINAGESASFNVDWTPSTEIGERNIVLTIDHDSADEPTTFSMPGAVYPDTLARWDFENGTDGEDVTGSSASSVYRIGVPDISGNGNHLLDYWDAGHGSSITFDSDIPSTVSGPNTLSGNSVGTNYPALFTWNDLNTQSLVLDIENAVLRNWSIEAFINIDHFDGNNGIVGRDGIVPGSSSPPLFFNIQGDGVLHCQYRDQDAVVHTAEATTPVTPGNWYYVAVVVNQDTGSTPTMTLYQADITAGESSATVMATTELAGSANLDFGPWPRSTDSSDADAWSIFRQMWGEGHVDRFFGNIDEIRISGKALDISTEGLLTVGVPVELTTFEIQ